MPYKNISDLPDTVIKLLPTHAQEIYLKAFNSAWAEYKSLEKHRTKQTQEEVCHKVAWSTVKKKYSKHREGNWILKKLKSNLPIYHL